MKSYARANSLAERLCLGKVCQMMLNMFEDEFDDQQLKAL